MPRVPKVSGVELVKILEKKGYSHVRTRGSHVRPYPPEYLPEARKVTVPLRKELKTGTLIGIMKDAGLSMEDLR